MVRIPSSSSRSQTDSSVMMRCWRQPSKKNLPSRNVWDFEAFAGNENIDLFRFDWEIGDHDADFRGGLLPTMRLIRCLKPNLLVRFVVMDASHAKRMFVNTLDRSAIEINAWIGPARKQRAETEKRTKLNSQVVLLVRQLDFGGWLRSLDDWGRLNLIGHALFNWLNLKSKQRLRAAK